VDLPEAAVTFTPYGFLHLSMLVLTVVGGVLLVWLGRRYRDTPEGEIFRLIFAVIELAVTFGFLIVFMIPPLFDLHDSLPLYLSDILRPITGYALLRRRPWAVALTYYWGLTLNPQALLTPVLHPGTIAPVLEITSYWSQHILVMWAAVYLTWGLGLHPNWRSYRLTLLASAAWAVVVFAVNQALNTNYGYLNRKPDEASLFDLMGGWPWYLLVAFTLLAVAWALMTWPWTRRARKSGRHHDATAEGSAATS
jgi:hypothetical integral membrane protein (TIGR02206 family)